MPDSGQALLDFARQLFPICRSITGNGLRQTLAIIQERLPEMQIHEVASGTQAFDWIVPDEWNIRDAYLLDPEGRKIIDFQQNNLHVVNYSAPIDITLDLEQLQSHLHSLPDEPNAIPYVTSYYEKRWGFCLSDRQRSQLKPGNYRAVIDSSLEPGHLTYGELLIPGTKSEEIFLSTYVCHPSMANNELSGPTVATFLASWLQQWVERKYSYRIVFIPETIGSLVYLSRNLAVMQKRIQAGFNLTCLGDDRCYSYLPSRQEDSLADRVVQHVLCHTDPTYHRYSFLDRGSDERQYCSPGIDLPVASLMRSKYGSYPEYHTSLDNFEVVTAEGLLGGFTALRRCIEAIEGNERLKITVQGEPQLGRRGLYPTLSNKTSAASTRSLMHLLAYADGNRDLLDIAEKIATPIWELLPLVQTLKSHKLLASI